MAAAIGVRGDYKAADVRDLARSSRDANQVRRLLTLAVIYEGGTRSDAARVGGVGLQTVRDWVLRFNAAGPAGLIDGVPPGGVPLLDDAQRRALAEIVERGPIPASHGVVRWRLIDLAQWVWDEFAISISKQTLSRELRAMGYRKLSARPRHHAQDADATATFKKLPRPGGGDRQDAGARHAPSLGCGLERLELLEEPLPWPPARSLRLHAHGRRLQPASPPQAAGDGMMADMAERIAGKWRIVETAIWDKQHLDLCGPAFIEIDAQGQCEMAFGALEASLDCAFTPSDIDFEWNGADEGGQVCGDGWADLRVDGCLEGEIAYHNGDDTTFIAAPWARFSAAC